MTKLPFLAGCIALLSLVITAIFATDINSDIFKDGRSCEKRDHTVTRHRSGRQPGSQNEGLRRRECGYEARAARRAARSPLEFDYVVIGADRLQLPAIVDSNSPAFWEGDTLRLFNSAWEEAYQSSGDSVENLDNPVQVELPRPERPGSVWLESVWRDPISSLLYGWYHFEPADLICETAPLIGAAISYDLGLSWEDKGAVLDTAQGVDCDYDNGYFVGGNGDFSVILGPNRRYFYFVYTNYAGPIEQQGIGVARSAVQDKGQPGTLFKYYNEGWSEPGLGGRQAILFGTSTGWKGPFIESYWGPSVHWNTYLNSYVALMNHTEGEYWVQEGVYIAFSRDMVRWTEPRKLLEVNDWYPQILGLGDNETDSVAGKEARVYVGGISDFIIQFTSPSVESDRRQPPSAENSPTSSDRRASRPGRRSTEP